MYNIKFTKIYRNSELEGGPRTDVIIGKCDSYPKLDFEFVMIAPPLTSGTIRYIRTTTVTKLENRLNMYFIETESGSKYSIEILD